MRPLIELRADYLPADDDKGFRLYLAVRVAVLLLLLLLLVALLLASAGLLLGDDFPGRPLVPAATRDRGTPAGGDHGAVGVEEVLALGLVLLQQRDKKVVVGETDHECPRSTLPVGVKTPEDLRIRTSVGVQSQKCGKDES